MEFKKSISNIAWEGQYDQDMYIFLNENNIQGLEIAPTRIFPEKPYDLIEEAKEYKRRLKEEYDLNISSMQSIWYGRNENIFASENDRQALLEYTKKAIDFAKAIECRNLVFGCPRNRSYEGDYQRAVAEDFFGKLGEAAEAAGVVVALEANPPIYNTNFLNKTDEVAEFLDGLSAGGLGINYDFGTVIYNREPVEDVKKYLDKINHVHISEPGLARIEFNENHERLCKYLMEDDYDKYISIEMGKTDSIEDVKNVIREFNRIFE